MIMRANTKGYVTSLATAFLSLALTNPGRADSFPELPNTPTPSSRPVTGQWLGALQQGFIPNVGQVPNPAVKFTLRASGVSAYFTDQGFVLWNGHTTTVLRDGSELNVPVAPRWALRGARPVEPVAGKTFDHTVSLFRGNDPANWHANVPAFRELRYPEILDGVELRVESRERGIEYSFHLQPHAKPDLRFRYDGITALETSLTGDLIVHTAKGLFTESRPVSYQVIHGTRCEVASAFEVVSANEYRIAVGAYDERHALVIDPVLDWSTFLGGSHVDVARALKIDPDGHIILAGGTYSTDLPQSSPAAFGTGPGVNYDPDLDQPVEDVFVAKLSSDGTQLLWLGYLAGNGATADAMGFKGLAVTSQGDVYIAGFTSSPDFPITTGPPHAGLSDAFVTKIQSDGSTILWSTLQGGAADDRGLAIALDQDENPFLAGVTGSVDFPGTAGTFDTTLGGVQDVFVTQLLGTSGAVQWSSYLGGDADDRVVALAAAPNGDVIVFGDTASSNFPTVSALDASLGGVNDAFVARLAADGTGLVWSTLLGGSDKEQDLLVGSTSWPFVWAKGDMTLDSQGNILVVGQTFSADFPTTPGAFRTARRGNDDAYVTKIASDGSQLLWSSYLGGSGPADPNGREETAWGVAVNPWDEPLVAGWSQSTDFPTTSDAFKPSQPNGIRYDGFLTKMNAAGSQVLYSTYIGGYDNNDVALGIAYDSGNVFVTGWAAAASFPVTAGAYQPGCVSCSTPDLWASDGYVMKLLDAFIAHDGFESGNYTGGGGGWAGAWTASGDISILTSSGPHSGTRHVRMRSGTGYLKRIVALPPAATSVRLGFWAKVDSFEASDRADVLVSANGVTWVTLRSFTPAHSDGKYHYYEEEVPGSLLGSQIQIAFDAAMNASNDNWYLDDIRVTGTSEPVPPVANAGPDQTVTADLSGTAAVTLSGSASFDPDGGPVVSYLWTEGLTPLGSGVSISPTLPAGNHTITLTVTDDEGATGSDTVQVTVNPYLAPVTVFTDSFELSEWNGLWTEDSQNDWFRSNQRASAGAGSWSAEVDGSASDASLTSLAINLQGRNNATITFDWLIESGLDSGEYLEFRVSTNGGSTWTQKAILRGNVDPENSWRSVTVELTGISQLKLQFRGKMNQADEDANVDNVRVVAF